MLIFHWRSFFFFFLLSPSLNVTHFTFPLLLIQLTWYCIKNMFYNSFGPLLVYDIIVFSFTSLSLMLTLRGVLISLHIESLCKVEKNKKKVRIDYQSARIKPCRKCSFECHNAQMMFIQDKENKLMVTPERKLKAGYCLIKHNAILGHEKGVFS